MHTSLQKRSFFNMRRLTYPATAAECKLLLKMVKKKLIYNNEGVELLKKEINYKTYFLNYYLI